MAWFVFCALGAAAMYEAGHKPETICEAFIVFCDVTVVLVILLQRAGFLEADLNFNKESAKG